jgi:hypothetical protein
MDVSWRRYSHALSAEVGGTPESAGRLTCRMGLWRSETAPLPQGRTCFGRMASEALRCALRSRAARTGSHRIAVTQGRRAHVYCGTVVRSRGSGAEKSHFLTDASGTAQLAGGAAGMGRGAFRSPGRGGRDGPWPWDARRSWGGEARPLRRLAFRRSGEYHGL